MSTRKKRQQLACYWIKLLRAHTTMAPSKVEWFFGWKSNKKLVSGEILGCGWLSKLRMCCIHRQSRLIEWRRRRTLWFSCLDNDVTVRVSSCHDVVLLVPSRGLWRRRTNGGFHWSSVRLHRQLHRHRCKLQRQLRLFHSLHRHRCRYCRHKPQPMERNGHELGYVYTVVHENVAVAVNILQIYTIRHDTILCI